MKKLLVTPFIIVWMAAPFAFANEAMMNMSDMTSKDSMMMSGMSMSGMNMPHTSMSGMDMSHMSMSGMMMNKDHQHQEMPMNTLKAHNKLPANIADQIDKKISGLSFSKLEKLHDKMFTLKSKIWLEKVKFKNNDLVLSVLNSMMDSVSEKLGKSLVTNEKIYIANEWDSSIVVIDSNSKKVIKSINLSEEHNGKIIYYSAHNVQVSPNGKIVAVTANVVMGKDEHNEKDEHSQKDEHSESMGDKDIIILIDPQTDTITWHIEVDAWVHLAHIVINNDATYAYFVSQKGKIYQLSLTSHAIEKAIDLENGSQPHGIRLSPDGKFLYIALLWKQALGVYDTSTDAIEYIPLWDKVVQVAITPDNTYAFASLYNTKRIARYNVQSKVVDFIDLPQDAQGPVQIYPSPDSNYLYVADQWYYFGKQTGHTIYKIDIKKAQVVSSFLGWDGPHGVVVSKDGNYVYVTNLLSHTLSVIDTKTNTVAHNVNIGKTPNGISIWTKWQWGTP